MQTYGVPASSAAYLQRSFRTPEPTTTGSACVRERACRLRQRLHARLAAQQDRFGLGQAGRREELGRLGAGDGPGVGVGDHQVTRGGSDLMQHCRHGSERARRDPHVASGRGGADGVGELAVLGHLTVPNTKLCDMCIGYDTYVIG